MTIAEVIAQITAKYEEWVYPRVFTALKDAGVTECTVDTSSFEMVYKGNFGTFQKKWQAPVSEASLPVEVGTPADKAAFEIALQRRMQKQTTYTTFLQQIAQAGIAYYRVDMPSKSVTYFDKNQQTVYVQEVPAIS